MSKIYNILILNIWKGAYRFADIWKIPSLGLLWHCHLQDSGHGFHALDGVQHAAHAQWTVQLLAGH